MRKLFGLVVAVVAVSLVAVPTAQATFPGKNVRQVRERQVIRRLLTTLPLAVAATAVVLALTASQSFAQHVQCGDVITQDTTLDSDLIGCPADGIVIEGD